VLLITLHVMLKESTMCARSHLYLKQLRDIHNLELAYIAIVCAQNYSSYLIGCMNKCT